MPNATTRPFATPPPPLPHNFQSTDRSRAELATRLLRLAGVGAEVKRVKVGGRDVWRVRASTDKLAAGREELRKALANIVREAVKNEKKAERWLEKLEVGLTLAEGSTWG